MSVRVIVVAALWIMLASAGWAKPPAKAFDRRPIKSKNQLFVGLPNPDFTKMTVYREQGGRKEEIWSLSEWPAPGFLADDGEHLIVGRDRHGMLPRNYKADTPILRFFKRGNLIKTVTIGDVIRREDLLRFGTSGFRWGMYRGFWARDRFAIDTMGGRRLIYDVTNGELVETTNAGETYLLE